MITSGTRYHTAFPAQICRRPVMRCIPVAAGYRRLMTPRQCSKFLGAIRFQARLLSLSLRRAGHYCLRN